MAAPPAPGPGPGPGGPPPGPGAAGGPPPHPDTPAADPDSTDAHTLAVDAQQDVQKLAVALAHAGANPQAVAQLTHMADILGSVIKVLGEGPELPNAKAPNSGPPGPPVHAPAGPPQGGPPAGPGPAGPGPQAQPAPPPPAHQALHHATQALHAMARDAAKQRAGQPQ